jgi:2-hydroxychromene-2-carboxylate isomerase
MTKTIEFIVDFGSPNAYLAWHGLKPILERTGATIRWTPSLLGGIFKATNNQPPFVAFGGVKGKLAYDMLEFRRFIARHGLTAFQMNPHFPVNTMAMMRGFLAAQRTGVEEAYVAACMKAMWEDGLKMDDPEVMAGALNAAGLDAQALMALSQTPEVKADLIRSVDEAVERGVFGIPTFFVGDEMFFGKDRLAQIEEELMKP